MNKEIDWIEIWEEEEDDDYKVIDNLNDLVVGELVSYRNDVFRVVSIHLQNNGVRVKIQNDRIWMDGSLDYFPDGLYPVNDKK